MHDTSASADAHLDEVRIVIVEDDDDALQALIALVKLDGYRVEGATTARQALDIVDQEVPHCVILDLGVPDISGIELARQLRARCGNELVVIAVTGVTDADAVDAAEAAGVDYVMSKPLDIERFRRIVPPLH
jgi:DNA-binding response OmpR family regulator